MDGETRVFADSILTAIEQPLLTDVEAARLPTEMNVVDIYRALADVLNERALPDTGYAIAKLNAYAVLHGVEFATERKVFNNIFIGASLEN